MMWEKLKRWRWGMGVAGALLIGLIYSFWPEAVVVDLGRVTRGPMAVGVTDDGVTRAEELYTVSAPVTGYARRIELKAGDRVERGDLITFMTGRPSAPLDERSLDVLRDTLVAAQATVRNSDATLTQARRDLQRAQALAEKGFVARAQLEAIRTRVATGEATLQQSSAEARRIAALLAPPGVSARGKPVAVRAPAAGSVLAVLSESENVISEGTGLVTIGDPTAIEIVVDLLSRDAVRVKPGAQVEITQWGGDGRLVGAVKRIEPFGQLKVSALGIEEQRVNVIVGFDPMMARRASRLGHGYQVEATIILWSRREALRVPIGALFRGTDGSWRVWAARDGRAREVPVTIGRINQEFGEVLSGLASGTQVVLNPGSQLATGNRIKPRQK